MDLRKTRDLVLRERRFRHSVAPQSIMIDCIPILAESTQMIPLYFGLHTLYVFITRDEQRTAVERKESPVK